MRGRRFNSILLSINIFFLSACASVTGGVVDQGAIQKTTDGVMGSQSISQNITIENVRAYAAIFPGEDNGKIPYYSLDLSSGEMLPSYLEIQN